MWDEREWLGVTHGQALRFFVERLEEVVEDDAPDNELLYTASVLAHYATTSTASTVDFPPSPTGLAIVFDTFVLDRSQHADPEIMEAAGSQCLLLTGFFADQLRRRHNLDWYAALGAEFYDSASHLSRDAARVRLLGRMAVRFGYWRRQYRRLAEDLREDVRLLK